MIYVGTPAFAVPPLRALVRDGHHVMRVYTRADRKVGRGQRMEATPVKVAALELGLPVSTPVSLKEASVQSEWRGADVAVVAAFGQILPPALLDTPKYGSINIHASLLPRWRGAAPVQRALMSGDAETGVCIMRMEEGLDTGPVFHRLTCPITDADNASTLTERLAELGAEALLESLPLVLNATPTPQADFGVCYAAKITKADALMDWQLSAAKLECHIRGLKPWPVAETYFQNEVIKVHEARVSEASSDASAGSVIGADAAGIHVATGKGVLVITHVQRAGRNVVHAAEFARGMKSNLIGLRLGEL